MAPTPPASLLRAQLLQVGRPDLLLRPLAYQRLQRSRLPASGPSATSLLLPASCGGKCSAELWLQPHTTTTSKHGRSFSCFPNASWAARPELAVDIDGRLLLTRWIVCAAGWRESAEVYGMTAADRSLPAGEKPPQNNEATLLLPWHEKGLTGRLAMLWSKRGFVLKRLRRRLPYEPSILRSQPPQQTLACFPWQGKFQLMWLLKPCGPFQLTLRPALPAYESNTCEKLVGQVCNTAFSNIS